MKLVIHDLEPAQWEHFKRSYDGWTVVSDSGTIRSCTGCFSCWHRTPGQCVIKDGYDNMGYLVHHAEEVHIISCYTYGTISSFVKNVFDRSLGYVLPQFEIVNGESHHQKRYDEDKPFTFIFYGPELTEAEQESARRYALSACTNFRTHVKDVLFQVTEERKERQERSREIPEGQTVLLNGSIRFRNGNSAILSKQLSKELKTGSKTIALMQYQDRYAELSGILSHASDLVLCLPLYVDGLPSQVLRFMHYYEETCEGPAKRVYVLANMGLYDSRQLANLFEEVRQWCEAMDFRYCGGLGVSAGELIGVMMQHIPFGFWPTQEIAAGMKKLALAIDQGRTINDIYAEPHHFPRSVYIEIANRNWNNLARKNGIDPKELYRRL